MLDQKRLLMAAALALPLLLTANTASIAQPGPGGPSWGPGMMMGPGMMGGEGFGFFCNPRMAGFAEWRIAQIEATVKPNDAQKKLLEDLKTASTKAAELVLAGCPTTFSTKPTERLEFAEKRMESMLQAIKMVRPAFQAFYDALDDKQKSSLNDAGPRAWGWRNWRWRWGSE